MDQIKIKRPEVDRNSNELSDRPSNFRQKTTHFQKNRSFSLKLDSLFSRLSISSFWNVRFSTTLEYR